MQRGDLDDLLAFVAIGQERSFTRAAAKLGVSQIAADQIEAEPPYKAKGHNFEREHSADHRLNTKRFFTCLQDLDNAVYIVNAA